MFRTGDGNWRSICSVNRVAAYTVLETVWITTHTFQHRIVTLMLKHGHVIATHEIGICNALLALSFRDIGLRHITCRHGHSYETDQCHHGQDNDIAATGHDLLSKPHADVTRWTNVFTNVTADAFCVVSVDIAAHGGVRFLDAEDRILGTKDDTVVTFETHATTHAPISFLLGVFFRETLDTFAERSQH